VYDPQDLQDERDIKDSRTLKDGVDCVDCVVTADEVTSVLNKLRSNKQDGSNQDLFRHAGVQLHIHKS